MEPGTILRVVSAFAVLAAPARAGGPGSAFGDALRLANTAQAIGMGEARVALGRDVSAISQNPAGVLDAGAVTLHATHAFLGPAVAQDYLAFAKRGRYGTALGIAVHGAYDSASTRTVEDAFGNFSREGGSFVSGFADGRLVYAADLAGIAGRWSGWRPSAGAGASFVWQQIERERWLGLSLDAGLRVRPGGGGLALGLAVQNLGRVSGDVKLPFQVNAGAGWEGASLFGRADRVSLELDGAMSGDGGFVPRGGLEYAFRFQALGLALRAGWKPGVEVPGAPGLTTGFGLRWLAGRSPWGLDYAYVPWGALGSLHAVALSVGLAPEGRR